MDKTSSVNGAYTTPHHGNRKMNRVGRHAYSTVLVRLRGLRTTILHLCTNTLSGPAYGNVWAYWTSVYLPEPKDPLNSMPTTAQQFPARDNVVLRLAA